MMNKNIAPSTKYGVWNKMRKEFQFGIAEADEKWEDWEIVGRRIVEVK